MNNRGYIEKFLKVSKIEKNLSDKTIKAYGCDLRGFLAVIDSKSVKKVEIEDLRDYLICIENENLLDSTIRRKLATIKVFFSFLEDEGVIELSPTRKLKRKFRVPHRLPRVMSIEEIENVLRTAHISIKHTKNNSKFDFHHFKSLRDCVILEILFSTGIRIGEMIDIHVEDIDINRKTLIINGKGRKERLLYISSDEVLSLITKYLNYRFKCNPDTTKMFLNKFGNPLSIHSVGNIFKQYCNKAKLNRKFTPHCLRHSMATMLIDNGADVRSVQEILGHSRISTTEIYIAVSKRRKEQVLSKFNQRNQFHFGHYT